MANDIPSPLPWDAIVRSWEAAEEALARLDQALAGSDLRDAWIRRAEFEEATAALWLEGALVPLEDLVLYDAGTGSKLPTRTLFQAHAVLRSRRSLGRKKPASCLTLPEILTLQERRDIVNESDPIATEMLAHDPDWDVEGRILAWLDLLETLGEAPALAAAALALRAWERLEPFQHHSRTIGRLLIPVYLQKRSKTSGPVLCLCVGFKKLRWIDRPERPLEAWLGGFCDAVAAAAVAGLERYRQLQVCEAQLTRLVAGRRRSSRLPALARMVLERPLLSVPMAAKELGISQQAAGSLLGEMVSAGILREASGRSRFRAYMLC